MPTSYLAVNACLQHDTTLISTVRTTVSPFVRCKQVGWEARYKFNSDIILVRGKRLGLEYELAWDTYFNIISIYLAVFNQIEVGAVSEALP